MERAQRYIERKVSLFSSVRDKPPHHLDSSFRSNGGSPRQIPVTFGSAGERPPQGDTLYDRLVWQQQNEEAVSVFGQATLIAVVAVCYCSCYCCTCVASFGRLVFFIVDAALFIVAVAV